MPVGSMVGVSVGGDAVGVCGSQAGNYQRGSTGASEGVAEAGMGAVRTPQAVIAEHSSEDPKSVEGTFWRDPLKAQTKSGKPIFFGHD